jgi:Txe/YoeB family toxin of Txe-Axe toxin-antitoxin module
MPNKNKVCQLLYALDRDENNISNEYDKLEKLIPDVDSRYWSIKVCSNEKFISKMKNKYNCD